MVFSLSAQCRHRGGQGYLLQHSKLCAFSAEHIDRCSGIDCTGHTNGYRQSVECHANSMDQYYNGWTTGTVAGRRACGSWCTQAEAAQRQTADDNQIGCGQCASECQHYSAGYIVGISARDGRRNAGQDETGYDYDLYLLCLLRYVQRSVLPVADQECFHHWIDHKSHVPAGRCLLDCGPNAGGLLSAATNGIPDGGTDAIRYTLFGHSNLIGAGCVGDKKMVRTIFGAQNV